MNQEEEPEEEGQMEEPQDGDESNDEPEEEQEAWPAEEQDDVVPVDDDEAQEGAKEKEMEAAEAPRFFTKWGMDKAGNYIPHMVKIRPEMVEQAAKAAQAAKPKEPKEPPWSSGTGSEPQLNLETNCNFLWPLYRESTI